MSSDETSPNISLGAPLGAPLGAQLRAHALALYGSEGTAEACLALQDRFGADVNLVLWCCWLGRHGVKISDDTLAKADTAVSPWRETAVQPLRDLRRRLKVDIGGIGPPASAAFRESVKAAEIEAELLELDHLELLAAHLYGTDARAADRVGVVRGNMLRYLAYLGVSGDNVPREHVERLALAAIDRP